MKSKISYHAGRDRIEYNDRRPAQAGAKVSGHEDCFMVTYGDGVSDVDVQELWSFTRVMERSRR